MNDSNLNIGFSPTKDKITVLNGSRTPNRVMMNLRPNHSTDMNDPNNSMTQKLSDRHNIAMISVNSNDDDHV